MREGYTPPQTPYFPTLEPVNEVLRQLEYLAYLELSRGAAATTPPIENDTNS
ncbi:UNVERIFIED_CONTAM: hypothetical protein HDU68_000185, partial [Siphonaria sp. JEL0065]